MTDTVEVLKGFYPTRKILWQSTFIGNQLNGASKGYFETGGLEWEASYIDGKQHGVERAYFETGELRWEAMYFQGKPVTKDEFLLLQSKQGLQI